jgi:hypothetical protein
MSLEKKLKNVAQPIFPILMYNFYLGKQEPKICAISVIKKLPEVNHRPWSKIRPIWSP